MWLSQEIVRGHSSICRTIKVSRFRQRQKPVGLSPLTAPPIKIQIACNIHQLPQHVNVKFSAKSRPGAAAYLPNDRRLFSAGATVVIGDQPGN
jgi:hypothetical protein